ncbi:hypothetical protein [Nonomuraea africana]|uniref:Excreted virulence factor EspC (Type VII ESX diderm) n=1 Tax=Nonomuraea africana TaxID=46171 RepID=A0ABR9KU90_9ACTN|nr:hypothetical protein [Nonomuraea africana]MBE1565613.1 hypothetical protein [Nonomuraea africana]
MDLHFEALDKCRSDALKAAGQYESVDTAMPVKASTPTDSTNFGKVGGAGGLAEAVDAAWSTLSDELGHAKKKLGGVETALDTVMDNVRAAHKATS